MSLSTTLDQLKKTLSTGRSERCYTEARARHRAFAPYATVGAVLATIARGSGTSDEERDAILVAILDELQRMPDSFWQALLLVNYTPTLVRLRASLRRGNSEDLDQSLLLAFVEAARSLKFRTYITRNLVLITKARLFDERRRERRAPESLPFEDETHGDPFQVEAHQRAAAAEVVRIIEAEGGQELREVLLATSTDGSSLQDYVDQAYAGCSHRVRARAGKRLRRARLEVFAKIRGSVRVHAA